MENQETYQRARKRVEAKIGFYIHFAIYIAVNILLIIINIQFGWFKMEFFVDKKYICLVSVDPIDTSHEGR